MGTKSRIRDGAARVRHERFWDWSWVGGKRARCLVTCDRCEDFFDDREPVIVRDGDVLHEECE